MFQELRASLSLLLVFTLITGIAYPLAVTSAGQFFFPQEANGSLVRDKGTIIGSKLIGQDFPDSRYFHGRPSAAGGGYDASNSSGSNLAPSSPDLLKTLLARVDTLRPDHDQSPIPIDLITASGSGLDPDISVASAVYQGHRVALARRLTDQQVQDLITPHIITRTWGFLGEDRVNVLALNLALDQMAPGP